MSVLSAPQIENILSKIKDPYTNQDLVSGKIIKNITVDNEKVNVDLEFGYPIDGLKNEFSTKVKTQLEESGVKECSINISSNIISRSVQKGVALLPNIKNTIVVASGKGGVGKSTTSVNLALALQAEGAKVGILDADIYGPSQPRMLGMSGPPNTVDGKTMLPKVSYDIQSMSIGYMIEEDSPMIWRGPMVTNALEQLLNDTNWDDLDYLIIDLPPGTGDIQLTLCQKIPISGAVIVTTPQDIALLDAKKALKMFEKVHVPVLGIIENMSSYICNKCGHEENIFGKGGGEQMSKQYGVELIGSLPLDINIREGVDNGKPSVVMEPDSAISKKYIEIARIAAAKLVLQEKDYSSKFPKIVIKND